MEKKYMIALDQGTTSSRAVIFDREQNIVRIAQREYTQIYPKEGWVEHDPMEIYSNTIQVVKNLIEKAEIDPDSIQIRWDAFSVLFPHDEDVEVHFVEDGYEHKRGWYNGAHIITCREVKPNEA